LIANSLDLAAEISSHDFHPIYRVVGVRTDGEPVVIVEQSTRQGAETALRLIKYASPFRELRIEGGPDHHLGHINGRIDEELDDGLPPG
jgi:hypothetical protein